MKTKRKPPAPKAFDFYLSNGDYFGRLTFAHAPQVRRLFKGCRIKGGNVYLA